MQYPDGDFLTLPELARWLQVDARTLRAKIDAGELPEGEQIVEGGQRRWDRDRCAVLQWHLAHPGAISKRAVNSAKQRKSAQNPDNS